jgi:hypothetical protein
MAGGEMGSNPIKFETLLSFLRAAIDQFPDQRTGTNTTYSMQDFAMAAFSVFYMQNPSFLAHQKAMRRGKGKDNAQTLFGIRQIPCDNRIRDVLDPVAPSYLSPVFDKVFEALQNHDLLSPMLWYRDNLLIALDGTQYFSSKKICCPNCSTTERNGTLTYSHGAIMPVIVNPAYKMAIPLTPEFIIPQDGNDKQDCETNAGKRWLMTHADKFQQFGVTILGDDLYCRQPMCQLVLSKGFNFVFVCKPDSHKTLYRWVQLLEEHGDLNQLSITRWNGKQREIYTYKYASEVPLRDSEDALTVNWVELTISREDGEILYKNAFATNFKVSDSNVEIIVAGGRCRWKVENENNNTLKTKGYNLEHNYGHGKQHLSSLLTTFILLAFLFHTVLEWTDKDYRRIRKMLPSRKTFFDDLRALTRYICFDGWQHLLDFMLNGLTRASPG